jgi:hypothetical protein
MKKARSKTLETDESPRDRLRHRSAPQSFAHKQVREALGVPHRRVQKPIRFDLEEVMAWARRWSQATSDQGIDAKTDPASQYQSLQQAPASLPV